MSGSTGADRIRSRQDFQKFIQSYEKYMKKFPGFVSIKPSGSYNSDMKKTSFGDIDLITYIDSNKDKATVKKELAKYLSSLPDNIIVPFTSPRYKGKRFLNTGEIITVRFHEPSLGYSVQIDNIIALNKDEAQFKSGFLDMPAEKQGLVLGLVKVATLENDPAVLFKKLGIRVPVDLPEDTEYEFNLSSVELQLRRVEYEPGSFKQKNREVVWKSRNMKDVNKLLYNFDLSKPFEELAKDAKRKLKNPRSSNRIAGLFKSMVSVKSGEVGTPKGDKKNQALRVISKLFEARYISFKQFIS